jgi:hypothetical protein
VTRRVPSSFSNGVAPATTWTCIATASPSTGSPFVDCA